MAFLVWCLVALIGVAVLALFGYLLSAVLGPPFRMLATLWNNRSGFNPTTRSGRWRLVGLAWFVVAAALIPFIRLTSLRDTLLFVPASLALYAGSRAFVRAQRYDSPTAAQTLAEDRRPPVVYLRSFASDAKAAHRIGLAAFRLSTEESELAAIVKDIGPLVAIGRPGEELPWSGAARVYVGESDWQERVRDMLKRAPLVILRAGATAGLVWEVGQAAKKVPPQRLVILVPLKRRGYDEFRGQVQSCFPCDLPDYEGRWAVGHTTLRAVLYFDDDWTPHLDPVMKRGYWAWALDDWRAGPVYERGKSKLRRILEDALEPVLNAQRGRAEGNRSKARADSS